MGETLQPKYSWSLRDPQVGFEVDAYTKTTLELGSRELFYTRHDYAVCEFLAGVAEALKSPAGGAKFSLFSLRVDLREITLFRPIAGLLHVLVYGDPRVKPIAAWLLGQCGERRVARYLGRIATAEQDRLTLQKHAIQALFKLQAWQDVWFLAERTDSKLLRRLAGVRRETHSVRLSRYLQHGVTPLPDDVPRAKMTFWSLVPLEHLMRLFPPKSGRRIREILDRIRHAVRGAQH